MKKLKVLFCIGICALYFFSVASSANSDKQLLVTDKDGLTYLAWYLEDMTNEKMIYSNGGGGDTEDADIKATYFLDTDSIAFKIAGVEVKPAALGTPILGAGLFAGRAIYPLNRKNTSTYCTTGHTDGAGSLYGHIHNVYVIYKIKNSWQAVYFYSSSECKNAVSLSDKGLKIQYENVVKGSGNISKRMLLIDNNGKTTDKFISKKFDKDVKRYNELFFWDYEKIQPTKH